MGKTTIEWAEHSINPFKAVNLKTGAVGHWCVKISGGCKNCYASRQQNPYLTQIEYRVENRPLVELFFDEKAIEQVLRRRKPTRYFWADMTDIFLDEYPDEWVDRCFAAMALTPQHTHMVLTKRSGRMRDHMAGARHMPIIDAMLDLGVAAVGIRWPLPNVWLGVSVEDRAHKTRIDDLRETPAAVRFLSLEPLLEDLGVLDLRKIDWVIVGGESGPGARPTHPDWVRSIRDQCTAAAVPFFWKQWGEWSPLGPVDAPDCFVCEFGCRGAITREEMLACEKQHSPANRTVMRRVGKKAAGRLLDGREWNEMPEVSHV